MWLMSKCDISFLVLEQRGGKDYQPKSLTHTLIVNVCLLACVLISGEINVSQYMLCSN